LGKNTHYTRIWWKWDWKTRQYVKDDDNGFAMVLRGLLHHMKDIPAALKEIRRVLRTGGFMLLQDGKRMPTALFEEMNEALGRSGYPTEPHPGFELEDLRRELSARGFTVEELFEDGTATFATPPYTPKVYSIGLFLLSVRKSEHGA